MRLSVSNIAWDVGEDEQIADLLVRSGVDAIDVAPGKYFQDPVEARPVQIAPIRDWWAARGIEITGMQALLFGAPALNVFGSPNVRQATLARLAAVCRIGAELGAQRLVFGSPRNRDRTGLSAEETLDRAISFFHELGGLAEAEGVCICLEPNPERYGANFMTTAEETAAVVTAVGHRSIGLQLDLGAMTITGENLVAHLTRHGGLVQHVHASEPDLVPLGDGATPHEAAARLLRQHLPNHTVCVEMVATTTEPHVEAVGRALRVAQSTYGDGRIP